MKVPQLNVVWLLNNILMDFTLPASEAKTCQLFLLVNFSDIIHVIFFFQSYHFKRIQHQPISGKDHISFQLIWAHLVLTLKHFNEILKPQNGQQFSITMDNDGHLASLISGTSFSISATRL